MSIKNNVFKLCLIEKLVPCRTAEPIMENDRFIQRQIFPHTVVCIGIKGSEEGKRHISGTFCFFFIYSLAGGRGSKINDPADRLIQHFDSV